MPDCEYGLVAPAPAGSASALADNESVARIERNKSTILTTGDARFAGRDTLLQGLSSAKTRSQEFGLSTGVKAVA